MESHTDDDLMDVCLRESNTSRGPSSSKAQREEVFYRKEEAVCVVPWDSGDADAEGEGEIEEMCPKCSLGFLRWFDLNEKSRMKMCNNVHCDFPFDDKDEIIVKDRMPAEVELDSKVQQFFGLDDVLELLDNHKHDIAIIDDGDGDTEANRASHQDALFREMEPLVMKYSEGTVKPPSNPLFDKKLSVIPQKTENLGKDNKPSDVDAVNDNKPSDVDAVNDFGEIFNDETD